MGHPNKRTWRWLRVGLVVASAAAVIVSAASDAFDCFLKCCSDETDYQVTVEREAPFPRALREKIVAAVLHGDLKPDRFGVAILPKPLDPNAYTSVVTVTRAKNDLLLIYFPTKPECAGIRGFLYCSRPLRRSDMANAHKGMQSIEVISDPEPLGVVTSGAEEHGALKAEPLLRQFDAHWWRVGEPDHAE